MMLKIISAKVKTTLTNRQKDSRFLLCRYSARTGTTAAFVAPSPTKSLNKFGIFNATKKASARKPVPKSFARITSLKNPRIRELNVPTESKEVDRIMDLWESGPWRKSLCGRDDLSVDIRRPFCYISAFFCGQKSHNSKENYRATKKIRNNRTAQKPYTADA